MMYRRVLLCLSLLCVPASAQTPEYKALGGSCLPENDSDLVAVQQWHEMVRRHSQLSRAGDLTSAVELARQIVRSRCSIEHWWLKLAEGLFETGRPAESVTALEALYNRKSSAVDRRLRESDSPLNRLLKSDVFQGSALAAKLKADRGALDQRRKEARARLAVEPYPPENYVAKNACPFECCRFGHWSVIEDTTLYDRPGGATPVGRATKGDRIEALTGEVHLRPLPVRVRFPSPYGFSAREGSLVFLLDYSGEGHGHAWLNGEILGTEILSVHEHCAFPAPDCWGEFVNPGDAGKQRDGVWWVQLKTRDGSVGWTREIGHFSDMDGCG
jgi:hypothetical protein